MELPLSGCGQGTVKCFWFNYILRWSVGIFFTVRFEICLIRFFWQVWTQKLCSSSWILAAVCSVVHQEDGRNLSNLSHSWRVVTNKIFLTWKIVNCTFQPGIIASLLFNSYSLFSPFISCPLLFVNCSWLCSAVGRGSPWAGRAQCLQSVCCSLDFPWALFVIQQQCHGVC